MWRGLGCGLLILAGAGQAALADAVADCRQSRDLDRRIVGCTAIIETAGHDPADKAMALRNRASARAAAGANEQAIEDYDAALRLKPDDATALGGRGQARLARGDLAGAIVDLSAALRLTPASDALFVARGHAYLVQGDVDAAIADFDSALRQRPANAVALNNRGLAHRRKGDLDRAVQDYTAAINANPVYALAYNNRGYAHEAAGRAHEASADYRRALLLDPALSGARDGLKRLRSGEEFTAETERKVREGQALVERHCGWCHAVGPRGASQNPRAPEFRSLHNRHPLLALREPLTRSIAAPHDEMPSFTLSNAEIDSIVAYINALPTAP